MTSPRTAAILAAITATLTEHQPEIDAGRVTDSITIVVKLHKSGAPARILYRPETLHEVHG